MFIILNGRRFRLYVADRHKGFRPVSSWKTDKTFFPENEKLIAQGRKQRF